MEHEVMSSPGGLGGDCGSLLLVFLGSHEHPHLGLGYNDLGYHDIMMKGILLSVTRKQVSWSSFSVELVNPANTVKDYQ